MIRRMAAALMAPLDDERRTGLPIQIWMRWVVIGAALFVVNYERADSWLAIDIAIVLAVLMNAYQQLRLRSGAPIPIGLPLLASASDAFTIVWGVTVMTAGFSNPNFAFLYPALLAFALVFPGRWSAWYAAITLGAYFGLALTSATFDASERSDVEELVARLSTLIVIVVIANIVVGIERERRRRAVALAVTAHAERERLSQEIHDGVAQGVYMVAITLEASASAIEESSDDPALKARIDALVRLAKQTLMETRSLLFNLEPVMAGREDLRALMEHQAREFSAVTGIPVTVVSEGERCALSPAAVGELYRVVQEGLANIYKHAEATSAELALHYDSDVLVVEIIDDGRGFEPAALDEGGHGLANIRERASRLGGTFDVVSAPGEGTRLRMTAPASAS